MGTITGKFHQNPLKTVGGVAETRFPAEKLLKGHNCSKNQLSMTSIKYAHLQVMGTITGKFHQNPLKIVGGVAETRLCLRTDGLTDGRMDGLKDERTDKPITIVLFDLRPGTKIGITKKKNDKKLNSRIFFFFRFRFLIKIQLLESSKLEFLDYEMLILSLMCLSIGTPKNNKFSICSKWKIHYF